ncbi:MAG: hypothetical protein K0R55_774, partial [Sporomusa sp.]|nr:hypothetical protein [Sporomusa sp.]
MLRYIDLFYCQTQKCCQHADACMRPAGYDTVVWRMSFSGRLKIFIGNNWEVSPILGTYV